MREIRCICRKVTSTYNTLLMVHEYVTDSDIPSSGTGYVDIPWIHLTLNMVRRWAVVKALIPVMLG